MCQVSQLLVPWCWLVQSLWRYALSPDTPARRAREWADVFERELARLLRGIVVAVLGRSLSLSLV